MRTILLVIVWAASLGAHALSSEDWTADIRQLIGLIEQEHPDPFTRIDRQAFMARAEGLIDRLPGLDDRRIAVEVMALVASLRDGHTTIHPVDPLGFNRWLPFSFYWFGDGVYVVSAHRDYADFAAARVVDIGGVAAAKVAERVAELIASDNATGRRGNIFYFGSVDALAALGIVQGGDSVEMRFVRADGRDESVRIRSFDSAFVLDESRFWGEMYAPLERGQLRDFVMAPGGMSIVDFARSAPADKTHLPLHVRHRQAYWGTWLDEHKTYYMQINHTTSGGRGDYESFRDFYDSVFRFVDEQPVERFILDIRYNSGGDGSVVIPFVHKFIRSDKVNREGRLFTITGRKTYSAATMLLDQMLKHTRTLVVGEPAGSALNSYGDSRNYTLANSGMSLDLSSEYWKLVHTSQSPRENPVDIPAVFSASDYFAGRDPAVDTILAIDGAWRPLDKVLVEDGGEAARARYRRDKTANGGVTWWRPFDESTFRKAARGLVDSRPADSLAGFDILVDAYPDSWRAWRDFGKTLLKLERAAEARDKLRRAAAINPGSAEVNDLIESLR